MGQTLGSYCICAFIKDFDGYTVELVQRDPE